MTFYCGRGTIRLACAIFLLIGICLAGESIAAQETDESDRQVDYVKLFEQGQDAHEKGNFTEALEYYDRALAAHPDFPEGEYQRAAALLSLRRPADAEKALRHATELRPEWSLPWATLGSLLVHQGKFEQAAPTLDHALKIDGRSYPALTALAELRLKTKAAPEQLKSLLEQLRAVMAGPRVPAPVWAARAAVERALGSTAEAASSTDRALEADPKNVEALIVRAELRADAGDVDRALDDALAARKLAAEPDHANLVLARIYARANRRDEANQTLERLSDSGKNSPEAAEIRAALVKCDDGPENVAALEKALVSDPKNPALLACLGAAYRRTNPARSLTLYGQAAQLEPNNIDHAIGFASALIQARRFDEAVAVYRRILMFAPDNFSAHSGLGTALYELKRYAEALTEFGWIIDQKPDLTVAYYFIATANDSLGRYVEALAAYQKFLSLADPAANQLEIEKVNLRLPSVRKLAERGAGKNRS